MTPAEEDRFPLCHIPGQTHYPAGRKRGSTMGRRIKVKTVAEKKRAGAEAE